MRREAGLLLHPTSLPGPYGAGDFGQEASHFLDWAKSAGQSLWQVLPLGPIAYANSPYASVSAYAGNPLLVPLDRLREDGLLPRDAPAEVPPFPVDHVAYDRVIPWKDSVLRASWSHALARGPRWLRDDLDRFRSANEQRDWLPDWTLYITLKRAHRGSGWTEWEAPLRHRESAALALAASTHHD